MRSDHLAKHTKTHENKAKKIIAKKGEKLEKAKITMPSHEEDRVSHVPTIKQEKIEEDDIKAAVFSSNYSDMPKFVPDNYHEASQSASLPGSCHPNKTSLDDYYQSYHPYQYQSNVYASNYFHQNSRFYQDKSYFYGHVVNDQSRGMFNSTASQPTSSTSSTQQVIESPLNRHQNDFYHQTSNFQALANQSSLPFNTSNNYQ